MGKLLKIEWHKIRKYRTFMILLAFFLVSIFGINYIAYLKLTTRSNDMTSAGVDVAGMMIGQPFAFPEVWQTVSYLSSFLLFIPGLIVIILMANEYSFRTVRQNVIDGVSRAQFINTKIALIFIIAAALTMVVFLTGLLFGSMGEAPFSLSGVKYLGYFFVNAVAYMSVALVIVLLMKRSGVSTGIYFLYGFIVENLLTLTINTKIWKGAGYFLPLASSDKLLPVPTMLGKALDKTVAPDSVYLLIASCVWILACLAFCKYRFQKSDL